MAGARSLILTILLSIGCGGSVEKSSDETSGSGTGAGGALSSTGPGAGGGAPGDCVEAGGTCVSLDLPTCGAGRVPFAPGEDGCGESNRCCVVVQGNDRCANAQPISLPDGTLTIEGDTSGAADEHAELTCESPNVAFSFDQGQLYYRFDATAGRTYSFRLSPSFYGFLYVFPAAVGCSFDAIQTACSSDGASGMVSPIVNPGQYGDSSFVPSTSSEYVLAVDGDTSPGVFTLTIDEI
ncbi:MAG: hypothetical protein WKG00_05035 [Polyangiaceae bacterium]